MFVHLLLTYFSVYHKQSCLPLKWHLCAICDVTTHACSWFLWTFCYDHTIKLLVMFSQICMMVETPFCHPPKKVDTRWLIVYEISITTKQLLRSYRILYYGVMSKEDRRLYKDGHKSDLAGIKFVDVFN